MSFCIKCGKQNPDIAKFCTSCGTTLNINTTSPAPITERQDVNYEKLFGKPAKSKKNKWVILAVIAILGLGTGAYFIFFNKKKEADTTQGKKNSENNTETYAASVQLDKMNILYIGIDNLVTIVAGNGDDDKVTTTIDGGGGSLTKIAPGKWIAKVSSLTDNCRISLYVDSKIKASYEFRVRKLPDPVATVGGIMSNENVSSGKFKEQAGIGAYVKDFPYNLNYEVVSYTLTADNENGDIVETPCKGNQWCSAALNLIRGLTPGRTVTIDNIMARGPDGIDRKIPGLVYYIK